MTLIPPCGLEEDTDTISMQPVCLKHLKRGVSYPNGNDLLPTLSFRPKFSMVLLQDLLLHVLHLYFRKAAVCLNSCRCMHGFTGHLLSLILFALKPFLSLYLME